MSDDIRVIHAIAVKMLAAMEGHMEWDEDNPGESCRWCIEYKRYNGRLPHKKDCILAVARREVGKS